MAKHVFTGFCRVCKCSEATPCTTPTGDACHWWSYDRTVCSNPPCVRSLQRELAQAKASAKVRNKKKTPAEIHALIRNRGRVAKQRRFPQ
ncbi:MAG: hypothetical protein ACYDC6_12480 [Acidobacteriaceae bacterium]